MPRGRPSKEENAAENSYEEYNRVRYSLPQHQDAAFAITYFQNFSTFRLHISRRRHRELHHHPRCHAERLSLRSTTPYPHNTVHQAVQITHGEDPQLAAAMVPFYPIDGGSIVYAFPRNLALPCPPRSFSLKQAERRNYVYDIDETDVCSS